MRIFKIMRVLIFITIFALINLLFNYALEPVDGASEMMWSEYRKEENLDMVYTGASFTLRAFNPYIIDEMLGTNSFNMATPAQPIDQTYVAIKSAIEEHHLKRVVLGLNYSTLETDWPVSASVAFMRAKGKNEPFTESIADTIAFMFDDENIGECTSINFLFPWIYNHVTIGNIEKNILGKKTATTGQNDNTTNDFNSRYIGKGFSCYIGNIDYNRVGNKNSKTTYSNQFAPEAFEVIRDIMQLCEKNEVELIVINTPRPVFDILSFGEDYFVKYERLKALFEEYNVDYYDFNLAKPEIFETKEDYYIDYEHLNEKGSTQFSEAFAKFLMLRDEEIDMEKYFYTKEDYLTSVNYITNCYLETENEADGIHIRVNAYCGTKVEAEYEISVKKPEDSDYEVIKAYSTDKEYLYKPEKEGEYLFRVNVRKVGSKEQYERYYEQKVYYSIY